MHFVACQLSNAAAFDNHSVSAAFRVILSALSNAAAFDTHDIMMHSVSAFDNYQMHLLYYYNNINIIKCTY